MTSKRELLNALKHAVRNQFAWPGGYAFYAICSDGEPICRKCIKSEFKQILYATKFEVRGGWNLAGIAYADDFDDESVCAHCSAPITE